MMSWSVDMRIPVFFGAAPAGTVQAGLIESEFAPLSDSYNVRFSLPETAPENGHTTGCACCVPRGPAATALASLFRARATGAAPFFNAVVARASAAGAAAIKASLQNDPLASARFRLGDEPG